MNFIKKIGKTKILIFIVLFILTLRPVSVFSEEATYSSKINEDITDYELPFAGMLADNPLYFLKDLRDKVLVFLTFDNIKKTSVMILISDKHLVMARNLREKGQDELSGKILLRGEEYLFKASEKLSLAKDKERYKEIREKLSLSQKKHNEVIEELLSYQENPSVSREYLKAQAVNEETARNISPE